MPSFDDYVRDHQQALVRYATLLAGSPTQGEDLVQDVLVRLYPRWDRLVGREGNVHAYVRRSITNQHVSWLRRWSTRHIHAAEPGMLEQVLVDPWDDGADPELWQRLQGLPLNQRAAIVLRFYEGLGDAEIGTVLSCREGTVRSHISRGLATIRRDLSGSDDIRMEATRD